MLSKADLALDRAGKNVPLDEPRTSIMTHAPLSPTTLTIWRTHAQNLNESIATIEAIVASHQRSLIRLRIVHPDVSVAELARLISVTRDVLRKLKEHLSVVRELEGCVGKERLVMSEEA